MSVTHPRGGASQRKLRTMRDVIERLILRGGQQPSERIVQAALTDLKERRVSIHVQTARVVDVTGSSGERHSVILFLTPSPNYWDMHEISYGQCSCPAGQYNKMCHHMLTALTVLAHSEGLKLSV